MKLEELMKVICQLGIDKFAEAVKVEQVKAAGLLTTEAAIYLVVDNCKEERLI